MALTNIEKKILRRVVKTKTDDEQDAIGLDDNLAKQLIKDYSLAMNASFDTEMAMIVNRENFYTQGLQEISLEKADRIKLNNWTKTIGV